MNMTNGILFMAFFRLDIDVEGHELQILHSLDFSRVKIDIISVENNNAVYGPFLEKNGYKPWVRVHYDQFYIHDRVHLPEEAVKAIGKKSFPKCKK